VSYLNTVPLVWGMLHGAQGDSVDVSFSIPSECARQLEQHRIDVGLLPVAEIARQGLEIISDVGIACDGAVRSILLFSRVPWGQVRTLAADASSRTSVQLARVILAERFGVTAEIHEHKPALEAMLANADAALIIGDPALHIEPATRAYDWLDLGDEWKKLTGLPMVFAAWAARAASAELSQLLRNSYEFGRAQIPTIVTNEYQKRRITVELTEKYLTQYIRYEFGPREFEGLRTFLQLAQPDMGEHVLATTTF
jgi:chorismate dehydratase